MVLKDVDNSWRQVTSEEGHRLKHLGQAVVSILWHHSPVNQPLLSIYYRDCDCEVS